MLVHPNFFSCALNICKYFSRAKIQRKPMQKLHWLSLITLLVLALCYKRAFQSFKSVRYLLHILNSFLFEYLGVNLLGSNIPTL